MGEHYQQLSLEERCAIAHLHEAGQSIRQIAAALDRAPSSNLSRAEAQPRQQIGYRPGYAQEQAARPALDRLAARARCGLRDLVLGRFGAAGRPSRSPDASRQQKRRHDRSAMRASTASSTPRSAAPTTAPGATICPGQAQTRRGWQPAQRSSADFIKAPRFHRLRPQAVEHREPGHWEADLMLFATYGQAILVAHERKSRLPAVGHANPARPRNLPPSSSSPGSAARTALAQTITFDNGTEFAQHHLLSRPTRHPNLLLRSPQPLAKGRHRKRHRTPARYLPARQTSTPSTTSSRRLHRRLQQHAPKVPRLQNPRRGLLPQTVALQM